MFDDLLVELSMVAGMSTITWLEREKEKERERERSR